MKVKLKIPEFMEAFRRAEAADRSWPRFGFAEWLLAHARADDSGVTVETEEREDREEKK